MSDDAGRDHRRPGGRTGGPARGARRPARGRLGHAHPRRRAGLCATRSRTSRTSTKRRRGRCTDREAFVAEVQEALQAAAEAWRPRYLARGREMAPGDLLDWWRTASQALIAAARTRGPDGARALVRPGHEPGVVHHRPADGNLGARPGRRRRRGRRPARHRPASPRGLHGSARARLQLQRARQDIRPNTPVRVELTSPSGEKLGARRCRRPRTSSAARRRTSAAWSRSAVTWRTRTLRSTGRRPRNGWPSPRRSPARRDRAASPGEFAAGEAGVSEELVHLAVADGSPRSRSTRQSNRNALSQRAHGPA